jgi:uncharacterized protein YxjI
MRYIMKQKIFSFGDKFAVKNENEEDIFYVEGKVFSLGNKLSFQDMSGRELIFIKQKLMTWSPTYEIYRDDQVYAVLTKEIFKFFNCKFNIEVGRDNIEVEGDFLDHEYEFTRNGRVIAKVSKEWFSWSDKYGIEINDGEIDEFILACVVAIDMICHNQKNN